MRSIKPKKNKCKAKGCGKSFVAISSLVRACSIKCAVEIAKEIEKKNAEKERKDKWKKRKEALTTLPELKAKAQKAFNEFVRERDREKPCVSCGTMTAIQWDAGHFLSVGSTPELRYEELNAHKQCSHCNDELAGNHGPYRKELINRIGIEKVEWLEGPHAAKKYTKQELRDMAAMYREKTRRLRSVRERALKWEKVV